MRNGVNRTALDVSYQLTEVVAADNFMHKSKFPLAAFKAMRTYRHRTAKQCRRKGWPCASREEVDAVSRREGSPYSGPKADLPVRKDGFVGAYQGAGRGNGTWMDPNGSIFVGECEDGMFQGRGWYTFSNGDKYSGDFSHGMKQRLTFCASLLHTPPLVIVDEPMVGLDPRGARQIKDVFRRIASEGRTVFLSTHSLDVAQEVCDRLVILNHGEIVAQGSYSEIRSEAHPMAKDLEEVFLRILEEESELNEPEARR